MLNDEFFRQTVEDIVNNPDNYSKEELHEAFLDMTERYLNEMVTSMNLENALTDGLGKESADELIEQIATSNPCINDLDDTNARLSDQKEVIQNLLDYVGFDLDIHSIDGTDDSPDESDNE